MIDVPRPSKQWLWIAGPALFGCASTGAVKQGRSAPITATVAPGPLGIATDQSTVSVQGSVVGGQGRADRLGLGAGPVRDQTTALLYEAFGQGGATGATTFALTVTYNENPKVWPKVPPMWGLPLVYGAGSAQCSLSTQLYVDVAGARYTGTGRATFVPNIYSRNRAPAWALATALRNAISSLQVAGESGSDA